MEESTSHKHHLIIPHSTIQPCATLLTIQPCLLAQPQFRRFSALHGRPSALHGQPLLASVL
ncbi:unnamed protein product [Rhodiola kirilowii]